MTPKQPTDNGPSKIVTLPATGTNATNGGTSSNGVGPGKIVTLPAGTVGKVGSNPVVKMTVPINRVTDIKPIRNPAIVKLNNNPPQANRFEGSNLQSRTSFNSSMNSNARFTPSQNQSQSFERRSFMH